MTTQKIEVIYCDHPGCHQFFTTYIDKFPREGELYLVQNKTNRIAGFQCKVCKIDLCTEHGCSFGINTCKKDNVSLDNAIEYLRFEPLCHLCVTAIHKFIKSNQLFKIIQFVIPKKEKKLLETDEDFITMLRNDLV